MVDTQPAGHPPSVKVCEHLPSIYSRSPAEKGSAFSFAGPLAAHTHLLPPSGSLLLSLPSACPPFLLKPLETLETDGSFELYS